MGAAATAFGPDFSRAMCLGAASLGCELEWPIATLILESGMNPNAANKSGARGLGQRMPEQVFSGGLPLVLLVGAVAPPGCVLRDYRGDKSDPKRVTGQTVHRLYGVTDPVKQLNDYFAFTRSRLAEMNAGKLRNRSALYCLNLAPARLRGGAYHDETVLYSMRRDDGDAFYPAAYQQNAAAFGLDPKDPAGRLLMKHLAVGLDAAIARSRARYDVELEAAYAANAKG